MEILVIETNNQIVTSTKKIAEIFEKEHFIVLRDLETLKNRLGESANNYFEISQYEDSTGKSNKMYYMNRDGFTLLAMGFTGEKALDWKIKYIEAFNKMEKAIKEGYRQTPLAISSEVREIREYGEKIIKAVDYIEEAADEVSKELEEKMELFGKLFNEEKMKEYCMEFIAKAVAGIGTLEQIESVFYSVQELQGKVKKLERGGK